MDIFYLVKTFLKEQKYGTDVIDGYYGLVDYFEKHQRYEIIYSEYNQNAIHDDGIVFKGEEYEIFRNHEEQK